MAKVKTRKAEVHVLQMQDGDVAFITRWSTCEFEYMGKVVQRYRDDLISIGEGHEHAWGRLFSGSSDMKGCYVEILSKGSEIIL